MLTCSRCKCTKDFDAFARSRARASGFNGWCRQCMADYAKARYKPKRPPDFKPQTATERYNRWRERNPERSKELIRQHRRRHLGKFAANAAAYRATKHRATPKWANKKAIRAIYNKSAARRAAGEQVHVDHIVPLKHPLVCGLHVESNLQIISAQENWRKNNRWWPGMP